MGHVGIDWPFFILFIFSFHLVVLTCKRELKDEREGCGTRV